ncbi:MAG: DUF1674 domain-containing protein [Devosia sp.]
MPETPAIESPEQQDAPRKPLSPAAQRALDEAAARRKLIDERAAAAPPEKGGRGGLEPNRYGDWEIKGLTADF